MGDVPAKSGNFEDYEFPKTFTAKDRIDFLNSLLAKTASIASVELFIDADDDQLGARAWFAET